MEITYAVQELSNKWYDLDTGCKSYEEAKTRLDYWIYEARKHKVENPESKYRIVKRTDIVVEEEE